MGSSTINNQLAELALRDIDGGSFERFAQTFMSAIRGTDFVPVGGTNDGGADGYIAPGLFEEGRVDHFLQASIQVDFTSKIRHTVTRLKEVGRTPKSITYITSQPIGRIDLVEEDLQNELGVIVRIRDQKYIVANINYSEQTIQSFNTYLSPFLSYLSEIGGATTLKFSPELPVRTLCVFLGQEVERRSGNSDLLESVTDSLILWALEGTNPDTGLFKAKDEILAAVEAALPAAKKFIRGNINDRLKILSSKEGAGGRKVNHHKNIDKYCLPFETRELVKRENEEDELLKLSVSKGFRARLSNQILQSDPPTITEQVVEVCHRALQITFENQGIEMAHFVLGETGEDLVSPTIADHVQKSVEEAQITGKLGERVRMLALAVLRQTFYSSSVEERQFLGKLSRTYILLFILKNEPKIVDYFKSMAKEFIVYVGSDVVVRAISEYYLATDDQMTNNTFQILEAAGSKLILSEKCLDEVWSHLKVTDMEYLNHYRKVEVGMTLPVAREIDRILLRAYYYAKLDPAAPPKTPQSWANFVGTFCDYGDLHSWKGREALKSYLIERYGFEFETEVEMTKGLDMSDVEDLAARIVEERHRSKHTAEKELLLAKNDALHVLRVYARRAELRERSRSNPFGYKTWWLTQENLVRRVTGDLVKKHGGFYMMRPEFLLHFIGLSPNEAAVRNSFFNIFPTLLGVKLSNRLPPSAFKSTIDEIGKVFDADEPRARAMMHQLSNDLKGNFEKQYDN